MSIRVPYSPHKLFRFVCCRFKKKLPKKIYMSFPCVFNAPLCVWLNKFAWLFRDLCYKLFIFISMKYLFKYCWFLSFLALRELILRFWRVSLYQILIQTQFCFQMWTDFLICSTVSKIYTPIFSFFQKRVANIVFLEVGSVSNERSSNSTFYRGIHDFLNPLIFVKTNDFLYLNSML